jgi:signal transduction histidine kinase
MRKGHWMALDFIVGAVFGLCCSVAFSHNLGYGRTDVPDSMLLAAAVVFAIGLRRTGPVAAFGVLVTLAVVVYPAAFIGPPLLFLAAAYVLYLVTTTTNKQTGAAALALGLTVMGTLAVAVQHYKPGGDVGAYVPVLFAMVTAWMTGYSVRQRRLYAKALQHQAASSAVAEERLRIARELHDVVAHSMSVIAVQAGYGQYVIDRSPNDAREALGAIQATSRDALDEMRRMLGVLRQQDAVPGAATTRSAPRSPAPGLSDLDRLVERTCGAGVEVAVERSGRVRAIPAGVDLSAYRIIQEALTNVVKHAGGGALAAVRLDYGDSELQVQVTDDGGRSLALTPAGGGEAGMPRVPQVARLAGVAPGAGHGIIGMRERAHLCGGVFSAGLLADGGFEVIATLPLSTAEAGGEAATAADAAVAIAGGTA